MVTGNKKYFFGKGTINNPDGLKYMNLNSENSLGKESCIAVQMEVKNIFMQSELTVVHVVKRDML